jgi:two-component system response regulator YesN
MKVILVDDERIAIDHMKNLIPWKEYGFEIAATASNGRTALRLCEEHRPQIMIVDIRMPVMDGIQLIRAISEKRLGVTFIVMSAYEDFEYARQALSLGCVSSYVIKHEVDMDKMLQELNKAKAVWESGEKQRQMLQTEQLKDFVIGRVRIDANLNGKLKLPITLVLIHPDAPFSSVPAGAGRFGVSPPINWMWEEILGASDQRDLAFLCDFPADGQDRVVLFSQDNKLKGIKHESLYALASFLQTRLAEKSNRTFSVYYSVLTANLTELPAVYRKLCAAAHHAVFCGRGALACADELLLPGESSPLPVRRFRFDQLYEALEQKNPDKIESAVRSLFGLVTHPIWDIRGLHEVVAGLKNTLSQSHASAEMLEIDPFDEREHAPVYDCGNVADRFIRMLSDRCIGSGVKSPISNKLYKALNYIREHYHNDINIEDVSHATGFSASYLHLLFKRELERTFLDYLTAYRIEQAKWILRHEEVKMIEVAMRVGYRSPQHFSQVFKKITGTLPHLYRDGGYRS